MELYIHYVFNSLRPRDCYSHSIFIHPKNKKIMIATTKRKIQNFEVDFYFFRFVHFLRKQTNPESTLE